MLDLLRKVRRYFCGVPGAKDINKVIAQFEKGVAVLNEAAENCNKEVASNVEIINEIQREAKRRVYSIELDNTALVSNAGRAQKIAQNFNKLCDM